MYLTKSTQPTFLSYKSKASRAVEFKLVVVVMITACPPSARVLSLICIYLVDENFGRQRIGVSVEMCLSRLPRKFAIAMANIWPRMKRIDTVFFPSDFGVDLEVKET